MQHISLPKTDNRPPGVSLIIAMIFAMALVIVSVGLAETQIHGLRQGKFWYRLQQARYAAEGVMNLVTQRAMSGARGMNLEGQGSGIASATDTMISEMLRDIGCRGTAETAGLDCRFLYTALARPKTELTTSFGDYSYYSLPSAYEVPVSPGVTKVKGTGNAAENCEFDINGDTNIDETDRKNADNPCHWNKIVKNQAVEIPLYYETKDPVTGTVTVINPKDSDSAALSLNEIVLRVRVPCMKDSGAVPWCKDTPGETRRPILYPSSAFGQADFIRTLRNDDILIYWNLLGDFVDGLGSVDYSLKRKFADVLFMLQGHADAGGKKSINPLNSLTSDRHPKSFFNTEITASRINCASPWPCSYPLFDPVFETDNNVLDQRIWGYDIYNQAGSILNYITNGAAENIKDLRTPELDRTQAHWDARKITRPRLQLQMLNSPRDASRSQASGKANPGSPAWANIIPYLEYQVLVNRPVADTKVFVEAKVKIGDIEQASRTEKKFEIDTATFTLSTN